MPNSRSDSKNLSPKEMFRKQVEERIGQALAEIKDALGEKNSSAVLRKPVSSFCGEYPKKHLLIMLRSLR